ncbi:MAG: HYR domain-containing protein, partial [Candidatus Staskawiczbacteria bacterium]|nr:HYR domain-containing protein [Candidatus Staskawiczbacteria bacterium]
IIAFDPNGLAGDEVTFNATTNDANLNTSTLSRGAGINPQPLANGFSSTAYVISGTKATAISNNEYFQVAISAKANYRVSLSSIDSNLRKSNTGPTAYQWQYSLDGFSTAGIDVGAQGTIVIGDSGVAMPQIDLSGVANLQNVAAGTTITFRLYAWGASAATGTFAIGRLAGNDLVFMGQVIDNVPPTFTVNNGTAAGPVQSDAINITVNDSNLNAASLEYGFSADNVCNVSDTYGNSFTNSADFSIAGNHTDYLCVKASDTVGNIGYGLVGRLNTDNTAPTLHLPANITAEATGPSGVAVTYSATADDTTPLHPVVNCVPASGSTFSINITSVNCSVTDTAGNNTAGSFSVTVRDTTAPVIILNGSASIDLHIGDTYTEHGAVATDAVDSSAAVNISGDTVNTSIPAVFHVKYDATDSSGNSANQVIRTVNVSDISAPVINAISNVNVEATGPGGAVATYGAVTATDDVDGIISATCSPSSGSMFSLGSTAVSCTATDSSGNVGNGTGLTVNITDNTPPNIAVLPLTQAVEAVNASGATATFAVTAADIVDGDISASAVCDATSGGIFSLGSTTVTCAATDAHGNKGTQTAVVLVEDTTAPVITVPDDITIETDDSSGKIVAYTAPTAADIVDGSVLVTCDKNSGDKFLVGTTIVKCSAADAATNTATKTFNIIVNLVQPPAPPLGGGGGGGLPSEPVLQILEETIKAPNITENSITLNWNTNFISSSYVIYSAEGEQHSLNMADVAGTPPKYGYAHATIESDITDKVTSHSVTITGLDPLTTYYLRTVSRGSLAISGEYRTMTPASARTQITEQTTESNKNIPVQTLTQTEAPVPVPVSAPEEEPIQPVVSETAGKNTLFAAGLSGAIMNIFSAETTKVWLPFVLFALILIIVLFAIIYFVKKNRSKI